jgi:hypothetical protein
MNHFRCSLALASLFLLPFAGCKSHDTHHQMKSATSSEWLSCCGKECDMNCPKDCCKQHFADKNATCHSSKVCDANCTLPCCKK